MGSSILLLVGVNLIINFGLVKTFNIDTKSPYIFTGKPGSFFGYSVAFNKGLFSVIVGAPKSNETNEGTKNWGSVYKCLFRDSKCTLLNKIDTYDNSNSKVRKDGQWMGATVYSIKEDILACAPRFSKVYGRDDELYMQGKCDYINPMVGDRKSDRDFVFNPCETSTTPRGDCQAGFSAKIFQTLQEDKICAGAFTTNEKEAIKSGAIAISTNGDSTQTFTSPNQLNFSDYMGYAVTTGRFKRDNKTVVVGGAPRGNDLGGKVLMYDASNAYKLFSTGINDPSDPPQTGSYFGAALASADINGDGFADLVVGAPQYANTEPNQGAVFVYLNNQKDGLVYTKQQFMGKDKDGFFGYSLGSVGDLNGDSMQEVAVGAPWGGTDGKGVVFLYYGSTKKNTPLVEKQRIEPSDVKGAMNMDGFGFSFADFYPYNDEKNHENQNNFDGKAYNDIAIGAYRSSHVVVLKSRQVITIAGELNLGQTTKIDLFNNQDANTLCTVQGLTYKCIKGVEACFTISVSTPGETQSVSYTIDLEAEQVAAKRGFFIDANGAEQHTITKSLNVDGSVKKCTPKLDIYLKNNTKDVLRPFGITMSWEYEETKCPDGDVCPVANALVELKTFKEIPYIKGCSDDGNDVCNSDLVTKLTAEIPGGGKTIAIGVTKTITVNVEVRNKMENAFLNYVDLKYPQQVSPNKVTIANYPGTVEWQPNVSADSDELTLRVILSSPIKRNSIEKVDVVFTVLNVGIGKTVEFEAEAKTGSKEEVPADNKAKLNLLVSLSANLTVSGNVAPEQFKWKKGVSDPKKIGPEIRHTFFFQNMGPSGAEESDIEIKIPEKINGDYILNIFNVDLQGGSGVQDSPGNCAYGGPRNPLGLNLDNQNASALIQQRRRKRRDVAVSTSINCNGGSECRIIKCKLTRLGKSQSATVTIESTLVEATFDKIKDSRQVVAFAKFSSAYVQRPNGAPPDTVNVILNVNSPYLKLEEKGDPIPWWVILLCILGAILIIGLIVFVLYKKGFFKRKKHGEGEEEELRQGDQEDEY